MVLGWVVVAALLSSTPPAELRINKHVSYEAERTPEGGLQVRFRFKDHTDTPQLFEHTYNYQHTLEMISRFGLPSGFFRPYTNAEAANRSKILDNGLFLRNGDRVEVDLSSVTNFYAEEFAQPIADFIVQSLRQRGMDTRTDRIKMAMAFTQDIPYGVPDFDGDGVFRSGLSPAPLILLSGLGDCDSKATLFAGILSYLINPEDILFLHQVNEAHLLTAIRDRDTKGRTTLTHNGQTYVLAETAGPGRADYGELGDTRSASFTVEPFVNRILPYHSDADSRPYGGALPLFSGVSGNVFWRGSNSQAIASREAEYERQDTGNRADTDDTAEYEQPSSVAPGEEAQEAPEAFEVYYPGMQHSVVLKCGESMTVHTHGRTRRVRLDCGAGVATAQAGHPE
ncbi:MAG: hypothetical protein ACJ8AT_34925 [Hyalangium sp.]|uniref:hypothetical protein n=1 Tax=Hyalangium sp. TaxID=2028555 RepID=UPI00389A1D06